VKARGAAATTLTLLLLLLRLLLFTALFVGAGLLLFAMVRSTGLEL
jgi:hypothetical protein